MLLNPAAESYPVSRQSRHFRYTLRDFASQGESLIVWMLEYCGKGFAFVVFPMIFDQHVQKPACNRPRVRFLRLLLYYAKDSLRRRHQMLKSWINRDGKRSIFGIANRNVESL